MAQPKIQIPKTQFDKIIEAIGWLGLVLLLVVPIYFYSQLPEIIPTHFGSDGQADAHGGKSNIWMLPFIGATTYLLIFWLNKFPHLFSYAKKITPENAEKEYKFATRMLRIINTAIVWLLLIIVFRVLYLAL